MSRNFRWVLIVVLAFFLTAGLGWWQIHSSEVVAKGKKQGLDYLLSGHVDSAHLEKALDNVSARINQFAQELFKGVNNGQDLSEILQAKRARTLEQQRQEAREMGFDLDSAIENARQIRAETVIPESLARSIAPSGEE